MTRNERLLSLGSVSLLAVSFLCAPSAQAAGGGPYDNDAPFGMPENNENDGSSPIPTASTAALPIVADVGARSAKAELGDLEPSSSRIKLAGTAVASVGDESDVAAMKDAGANPTVVEVEAGTTATLDSTSQGVEVSGEFRLIPGDAPVEFKAGQTGDLRTAYVVVGEVDALGRMQTIHRIVALPLWGHDGIDLRELDAAASQSSGSLTTVGLDVIVILTSLTFDLETGKTSTSIDGSAQFEVGDLEAGIEVSTRGL